MIVRQWHVPAKVLAARDEPGEPGLTGDALDPFDEDDGWDSPRFACRFVVREEGRALIIRARDVDFVEAARNYVLLHVGNKEISAADDASRLHERLDPRRFARIHKSVNVNIDRIREIQPWFGGDHVVLLRDGKKLRVSRTYARDLLRPIQ